MAFFRIKRNRALRLSAGIVAALLLAALGTGGCRNREEPEPARPTAPAPAAPGKAVWFTGDLPDTLRPAVEKKAAQYGLEVKEDGCRIEVVRKGAETDQAYEVVWAEDGSQASVYAGSDDGIFYACKDAILGVCFGRYGEIRSPEPAVPFRGVIEGFYGEPWTHEFRLSLMEFLGDENMNTYIYAPKDDAKHRNQWRSAYSSEEIERLTELVSAAKDNRVQFVYALSPGNDIALSGTRYEKDFEKLLEKMQSVYDIGVRSFAIFLDDIAVKDAAGHAKLLNDFQEQFVRKHGDCENLLCISPEYTDPFYTSAYTDAFAKALDPDIAVMWTGPGVVPASITAADLERINAIYQRKMYIWWNYPVNDTMRDRLFLDACRGLSPDLTGAISGLVANPMNEGEASEIPLATLSDFLIDPQHYDADTSLREAAERFTGYDSAMTDALLELASHTSAGVTNGQTESVKIRPLVEAWREDKTPGGKADLALREAFAGMAENAKKLLSIGNERFLNETQGWIGKMEAYGEMGRLYLEIREAAESGSETLQDLIAQYDAAKKRADATGKSVSASVLSPFFYAAADEIDRMAGRGMSGRLLTGKVSASIPVYQNFALKNACDNDPSTFYWSAGAFGKGDYIRIDLGEVCDITAAEILCGAPGHENDYIHDAELQISEDGKNWVTVDQKISGATVRLENLSLRGRYLRLVSTKTQEYWVTVMEFRVYSPEN